MSREKRGDMKDQIVIVVYTCMRDPFIVEA